MTLTEKLATALGMSWAAFKAEHPRQAADVEQLGDAPDLLMDELETGAEYAELVRQSDDEVSVASLVGKIAPLLPGLIGAALAAG